jgi:hypothetical protein
MTLLASPTDVRSVRRGQPSARRLLGGAIVGALGAIVLSVASGAYVATTRTTLPAAAADDARALAGWIPAIVAVGFVHFLVAAAMVRGRDLVRVAAAALIGLVAIAAATAASMIVAGVDPFGWSAVDHPSGSGVGILAVTAALYGVAALAAGSGPAAD